MKEAPPRGALSRVERDRYARDPKSWPKLSALARRRVAVFENDRWPVSENREPLPVPDISDREFWTPLVDRYKARYAQR